MTITKKVTVSLVGLAAVLALTTGCTKMTMAVPPGLAASADTMPVDRPKFKSDLGSATYKFGPYVAAEVDREGKRNSGFSVGGFGMSKSDKKFSFNLQADGEERKAQCVVQERNMSIGGWGRFKERLICTFSAEGREDWTLQWRGKDATEENPGLIQVDKLQVGIVDTNDAANTSINPSDPTGFIFKKSNMDFGAIDVNNLGVVYMRKGLSPDINHALACASVAMLVYADVTI